MWASLRGTVQPEATALELSAVPLQFIYTGCSLKLETN